MSYKIKNGQVWVWHEGKWWLDEILYAAFPELKDKQLVKV